MTYFITMLKATNPIVMTVANTITSGDVANGLNAIGASPIMPSAPEEAEAMVNIAQGVTINVGSINQEQFRQSQLTCNAANSQGKPLVLDPVAVASSPYRSQVVDTLLGDYDFSAIRGNVGEIAFLAGVAWDTHGIDAGGGEVDFEQLTTIVKTCAQKYHTIVIMTGEIDYISDGKTVKSVPYGTPAFATHVGTGDLLSSLVAAFLTVASTDEYLEAAYQAALTFALCGQKVSDKLPGQWFNGLLNELYLVSNDKINHWEKEELHHG